MDSPKHKVHSLGTVTSISTFLTWQIMTSTSKLRQIHAVPKAKQKKIFFNPFL